MPSDPSEVRRKDDGMDSDGTEYEFQGSECVDVINDSSRDASGMDAGDDVHGEENECVGDRGESGANTKDFSIDRILGLKDDKHLQSRLEASDSVRQYSTRFVRPTPLQPGMRNGTNL